MYAERNGLNFFFFFVFFFCTRNGFFPFFVQVRDAEMIKRHYYKVLRALNAQRSRRGDAEIGQSSSSIGGKGVSEWIKDMNESPASKSNQQGAHLISQSHLDGIRSTTAPKDSQDSMIVSGKEGPVLPAASQEPCTPISPVTAPLPQIEDLLKDADLHRSLDSMDKDAEEDTDKDSSSRFTSSDSERDENARQQSGSAGTDRALAGLESSGIMVGSQQLVGTMHSAKLDSEAQGRSSGDGLVAPITAATIVVPSMPPSKSGVLLDVTVSQQKVSMQGYTSMNIILKVYLVLVAVVLAMRVCGELLPFFLITYEGQQVVPDAWILRKDPQIGVVYRYMALGYPAWVLVSTLLQIFLAKDYVYRAWAVGMRFTTLLTSIILRERKERYVNARQLGITSSQYYQKGSKVRLTTE
jgi:hypothetical protein